MEMSSETFVLQFNLKLCFSKEVDNTSLPPTADQNLNVTAQNLLHLKKRFYESFHFCTFIKCIHKDESSAEFW